METRHNKPKVSYRVEDMHAVESRLEDDYMDCMYGRPVVIVCGFPVTPPKWFKKDMTLNFGAGRQIVRALAYLLHHVTEEDNDVATEEDLDYWPEHEPFCLTDMRAVGFFVHDEWENGDIVGYCEEKMDEDEDPESLACRLGGNWEDVLGVSEDLMMATTLEDARDALSSLLELLCDAYRLQWELDCD